MLPPPSTRARLPAPVCANTAILLALMVMVSLPAPALRTSNIRIQDIENIDITGSGDNDLTLNLNDVLDASTSTNILKVLGNNGDSVNASGFAKISGDTSTVACACLC
jgi:hypothetical protein